MKLAIGDIIRTDGKNSSIIISRVNKGSGIVAQIMDMLKAVSFGSKYFEIAITLREAHLINGMLTSADVWYGLQKSEITELEQVDRILLRRILGAPDSTCVEALYLELGLTPISVILKIRRVMFLHYLATQKEDEMLHKFFIKQWKYPTKDDWTEQARNDLEELDINLGLEEIKSKSEYSFKKLVKRKGKEFTLNYFLELKEEHTKMEKLDYNDLKLQNYLMSEEITAEEAKNLFRFRTRSAFFKENMKTGFQSTPCPFCHVQPDNQTHSMVCPDVNKKIKIEGNYDDIFQEDIPADISKTLLRITKLREDVIIS